MLAEELWDEEKQTIIKETAKNISKCFYLHDFSLPCLNHSTFFEDPSTRKTRSDNGKIKVVNWQKIIKNKRHVLKVSKSPSKSVFKTLVWKNARKEKKWNLRRYTHSVNARIIEITFINMINGYYFDALFISVKRFIHC